MQKSDWYKILAIGFVAVFMLEMIAIGFFNSGNTATPGGNGQALPTLTGQATEDMTIARYEPYLIVSGNGSAILAAKEELLQSGAATYEVPSPGGFVLNLRSGSEVPSAAAKLEAANATVLANAVLSTPSTITVVGEALTVKAQGASFTTQLRPIYDEGSRVPATFFAGVENGQLVTIGSLSFLPDYVESALVRAEIEGVSQMAYLSIPWENRSAARQIARQAGAEFSEKSYILVGNATEQQLNATAAATAGYSTGVGRGIVSVRNDFADRARAQADLAAIGIAAEFPPSTAVFANDGNGSMAESLRASLEAAGIAATVNEISVMKLRFPASFEWEGRTYGSEGYEIELEGVPPEGASAIVLDVEFEALGGKVSRFGRIDVAAQQGAPVPAPGPSDSPDGAGNSS